MRWRNETLTEMFLLNLAYYVDPITDITSFSPFFLNCQQDVLLNIVYFLPYSVIQTYSFFSFSLLVSHQWHSCYQSRLTIEQNQISQTLIVVPILSFFFGLTILYQKKKERYVHRLCDNFFLSNHQLISRIIMFNIISWIA